MNCNVSNVTPPGRRKLLSSIRFILTVSTLVTAEDFSPFPPAFILPLSRGQLSGLLFQEACRDCLSHRLLSPLLSVKSSHVAWSGSSSRFLKYIFPQQTFTACTHELHCDISAYTLTMQWPDERNWPDHLLSWTLHSPSAVLGTFKVFWALFCDSRQS